MQITKTLLNVLLFQIITIVVQIFIPLLRQIIEGIKNMRVKCKRMQHNWCVRYCGLCHMEVLRFCIILYCLIRRLSWINAPALWWIFLIVQIFAHLLHSRFTFIKLLTDLRYSIHIQLLLKIVQNYALDAKNVTYFSFQSASYVFIYF